MKREEPNVKPANGKSVNSAATSGVEMRIIASASRRQFLKGAAAASVFVLGWRFLPASAQTAAAPAYTGPHADHSPFHPNVYLGIDPDGTVYLVAHRSEMGTTSRTSVPMILADELDADWKRVKLEQAIGDERYGDQNTDGSHSVRSFYETMRQAGATARLMLVQAAAKQWGVPVAECSTDLHVVVHKASGKTLGYGALASAAAQLPVPKKEELQFKPKSAWRYVGKGAPGYDLAEVCAGTAVYGMDARMENMAYASIEHPPVLGGKVRSLDDKEALKVTGVRQTVQIDPFTSPWGFQPLGGVAVIADNTWAAFQGRAKLNVTWENGAHASYNSDQYKKELRDTARKPGKVIRSEGDVDAAFANGNRVMEADYYVPHLAHASMEPPVAVADFRDGKVTAWAPTQNPQEVQNTVSKILGIPKEDVICHVTLLGGGFGRKSKPDYVAEAAVLSKKLGRPVKVVWKREDDIKFDYYHSVAALYMKAAVDASGMPTAWMQRSVFPPIGSMNNESERYAADGEMGLGWTELPFQIANLRVENGPADAHVRIGWLRSVCNIYHAFAIQSFANELSYVAKRDPLDYLLDLMGPPRVLDLKNTKYPNYGASIDAYPVDIGRLRRVTEMAAEKAGWGKRTMRKGTGLGIAAHRSFLTYVATVVEVEVNDQGQLRIPRVDTVVDAGLVVNPEATRNQFEGAAVFGTSIARTGAITATKGVVDQSNFHDYRVARINESPYQTNVYIVDSDAPPAGVGEPGVPPFIPALCNAIYAATGKRIRELPIGNTRLI